MLSSFKSLFACRARVNGKGESFFEIVHVKIDVYRSPVPVIAPDILRLFGGL